jgi:CRP/FNR family transcriptional regulator, cyclic AMP receptor protein
LGSATRPEPFSLLDPFDGISDRESAALDRAFPPRRWAPGSPMPEGGGDEGLVIVRSGMVAVMVPTVRGRDVAVALLVPGDLYPATTARFGACLEPLGETSISIISAARLRILLQRAPEIGARVVGGLATQLAEAGDAAGALSEVRVEDRLIRTLRRLTARHAVVTADGVELTLELSHAQWATLVGASREAVTAALIRLRRRGTIRCRGRVVVIPHERAAESAEAGPGLSVGAAA